VATRKRAHNGSVSSSSNSNHCNHEQEQQQRQRLHFVLDGKDSKTFWLQPGTTLETFLSPGVPAATYEVVKVIDESPVKKASFQSPGLERAAAKEEAEASANMAKVTAANKKATTTKMPVKMPSNTRKQQNKPTKTKALATKAKKASLDDYLFSDGSSDVDVNNVSKTLDMTNIESKMEDESKVASSITTCKHGGRGKQQGKS